MTNRIFLLLVLLLGLIGGAMGQDGATDSEREVRLRLLQDQGMSLWEATQVLDQEYHPVPRLRVRRLSSPIVPRASLWAAFNAELDAWGEARYQRLKPMVLERSIQELQAQVATGAFSYTDLTLFYLYRIRLYEGDERTALNAVISLNPAVLADARERDAQRREGRVAVTPDSVFGMPILLKDNIGAEGTATTAGAEVLADNRAPDAFITRQLRNQGALILGKANLSEWAYYFCDGCPLGYSAMGGQTLNPYGRLRLESGGSSSGSAVAVAANYAVAAVGTETSGSILSPASANLLVGLKPTTGMLSRRGIVPISSTLDTPGPITRSVGDAVVLFNAMAGLDSEDVGMSPLSALSRLAADEAASGADHDHAHGRHRLGYFPELLDRPAYQQALQVLRELGADLIEVPSPSQALPGFSDFMGGEMRRDLASYLTQFAQSDRLLAGVADVVNFNRRNLLQRAPYGQGRFEAMLALEVSDGDLQAHFATIQAVALAALGTPMAEGGLEALVSLNNLHAGYAAAANFPALTVPMGLTEEGAPAGVTLIAPTFGEQSLVDLGAAFEAATLAREGPADYQ